MGGRHATPGIADATNIVRVSAPRVKAERVALLCNECGHRWQVSPNAADPQCSKCGSVDYEVRS